MKQNMEWKGKYKSELLMVCHKDAQAMHDVGAISDEEMREYDRDCLVSSPQSSYEIRPQTTPVYASPSSR